MECCVELRARQTESCSAPPLQAGPGTVQAFTLLKPTGTVSQMYSCIWYGSPSVSTPLMHVFYGTFKWKNH